MSAGCKVIGICGSAEKCQWIKDEFGFDAALNYKADSFRNDLKAACSAGIDCYFDNVGGELSSTIIHKMNEGGRIAVCGAVSVYNKNPCDVPESECLLVKCDHPANANRFLFSLRVDPQFHWQTTENVWFPRLAMVGSVVGGY